MDYIRDYQDDIDADSALLQGELADMPLPYATCGMTTDRWKDIVTGIVELDEYTINPYEANAVGFYSCRFCHSNKTATVAKQTRSADEATSVFVHCISCGKNFRVA